MTTSQLPDLLSTREAAALLGVGASSIKRWADQGLIACVKTAGGHRRSSRAVIDAFRDALARGSSAQRDGLGGAVVEVAAEAALQRSAQSGGRLGPFESALLEALLVGESPHAIEARLLRARGELGGWGPVVDRIGDLLTELGNRWCAGSLSILDEHLASERLGRALARVVEWQPAVPNGPPALLMAALGEEHTLGLLLVEVCLRELGWTTLMVGRSAPVAEKVRQILDSRPPLRLVAVSASIASNDEAALSAEADALGAACRAVGATLILGGAGAWPERLRYGHRVHDLVRLRRLAVLPTA